MTDHDKPMSMVERCARAICVADAKPLGASTMSWETISESHRDTFRTLARAAISAMREPTEGMIEAAVMPEYGDDLPRTKSGQPTVGGMATAHWQTMIDAALSEHKTQTRKG